MKIFKQLFILLSLIATSSLTAQNFNKAKLDSLFNMLGEYNKAMGSIAISKDGKLIYTKSIGCSSCSEKENVKANDKTKYRIGSVTKMFTATMIFQLIEERKLSLDTKLSKYYPQLKNADKITIRNLLNHRSGLHDFTHDVDYSKWNAETKTHDQMLAFIANGPSEFDPGSKADYSNSNYVVLGYIIEKITSKEYKDALTERICKKIKLENTNYGGATDIKKNDSYSYNYLDGWQQEAVTDMSIPHGAGAIISTPTDLVRFAEALFKGKLVKLASVDSMKTMTDGYGYGMFDFPFGDKKIYGHTGSIDAFSSLLGYFPENKIAVAYCTNGQVYPMNDIIIAALNTALDKPFTLPVFKTITLKTEELDKYLGVYSSTLIPVKITITKENTTLMAQGTDQPSFPLDATEKDNFSFDKAGVVLVFNPDKGEMTLKQGGGEFLFVREK